jgi:hypothetical protein
MLALVLVFSGAVALTADRAIRDDGGFLGTGPVTLTGDGYALTSEKLEVRFGAADEPAVRDLLGDVRLQVTGTDPAVGVFVGIGPSVEVERYLAGVAHQRVTGLTDDTADYVDVPGTAAPADPAAQTFWAERDSGPGTRSVTWTPRSGDWTVVVMRADGARAPSVDLEAQAQAPVVTLVSGLVLAGGLVLLLFCAVLVLVPVVRAVRTPRT